MKNEMWRNEVTPMKILPKINFQLNLENLNACNTKNASILTKIFLGCPLLQISMKRVFIQLLCDDFKKFRVVSKKVSLQKLLWNGGRGLGKKRGWRELRATMV